MGSKKPPKKEKLLQPTILTQKDEAAAASILQKFDSADPAKLVAGIPDSHHAVAIIERVCADKTPSIPLLLAIKDGIKDKQVQKAVKRATYRLSQRGIQVAEFSRSEAPSTPILKAPQGENPAAFVGPILNMFGSRAVFLTHCRATKGQYTGTGLVSDQEGIHEFLYGAFSKRRSRELKDHLSEKAGPLVETSLSHAATILERAHQRQVERNPVPSSRYLELRPWLLENAPILGCPAMYPIIPGDQVPDKVMTRSQMERLFEHKLLKAWRIEFELLRPFMEQLINSDRSPIVLTEVQKTDQAMRIREKCIAEIFSDPERALLKHRLEEMAFIFFKLKEEDYYRLCRDAAHGIGHKDNLLKKDPVIEFFVERSLGYYMNLIQGRAIKEKETEDNASSGLILP